MNVRRRFVRFRVHLRAAHGVVVLLTLAAATVAACSDGGAASADYDRETGNIRSFAFDVTGTGRRDAVGYLQDKRLRRIEIDLDGNGLVDRWDFYNADGTLEKVGLSQRNDGVLDAEAFYTASGELRVMRVSSQRDGVFDRTEYYEQNQLVREETDTDRDGRPDKWDTYRPESNVLPGVRPYAITSTAIDERGRGTPTRRLVYGPDGRVARVEVDPDGDGHFSLFVR